jgi:GNAT superfamily N-acetyltransferase
MPLIDVKLDCPIHDSARVRQVAEMFDLPWRKKMNEHFVVEIPAVEEPWQIGVIVGPSGSGKTAVARKAFGASIDRGAPWPVDRAVIDCFGDLPIKVITQTLSAVGFSSPPAWIKPYPVLSNGEKFRCNLARALLFAAHCSGSVARPGEVEPTRHLGARASSPAFEREERARTPALPGDSHNLVVFDEFTSVVDRTVARIGSAAVSRALRSRKIKCRFVAVTCHYDVVNWLEPDWVVDMASQSLARGRLRGPAVRLDIRRADRSAWAIFSRHHYLSGNLHRAARCFVAWIDGLPAAFTAVLPFPHPIRPGWREHRTVCLPDFQGIGIGAALSAFVASLYVATGKPYFSTTGHPAVIEHRMHSPLWKMRRKPRTVSRMGASGAGKTGMLSTISVGRVTAGFEYVGPARGEQARAFGIAK